jgi:hypothetical protein
MCAPSDTWRPPAIGYPRGISTDPPSEPDSAPGDDPRHRIRQLVLSGDNLTKARNDPASAERARQRYADARELAVAQRDDDLVRIIDLRLGDLSRRDVR